MIDIAARSMRASEERRRSSCRDAVFALVPGSAKFMASVIIHLLVH
jgi:hypothetical protein